MKPVSPRPRAALIKRAQARFVDEEPPPAAPPVPAHARAACGDGIAVRVERASETSTELRVICGCGATTVIVCEHDPARRGS